VIGATLSGLLSFYYAHVPNVACGKVGLEDGTASRFKRGMQIMYRGCFPQNVSER